MKDKMSSVDVAVAVAELQMLVDARLDKVYQHEDEIRLKVYAAKERHDLLIKAGMLICLTKYPRPSMKIAPSYSMLLRKHLSGGRITSIEQYDFDRVIEIHVQRGDLKRILIVELLPKGNIILLSEDRKIILPLTTRSLGSREVRRGEQYAFPPSQKDPIGITESELKALFEGSNKDLVRTLSSELNMGGLYAEEVCIRAGVDKNTPASELSGVQLQIIHNALRELFEPISSGKLHPHIVFANGEEVDALPFELHQYADHEKVYFDSFNEALDEFFSRKAIKSAESIKDEKLVLLERTLNQQGLAIEEFKKEEKECIKKAEIIYTQYQHIERIFKSIHDARGQGSSWKEIKSTIEEEIDEVAGILTIELDGAHVALDIQMGIPQNAQRYYQRAKKIRKKLEGAERALEQTKKDIEQAKSCEIELKNAPQRRIRQREHWYDRFRHFTSSEGFLVIGGRDASTNEEIVKKHMEASDVFFHTQAHGAPVVIIKADERGVHSSTLEEAAQFAVSYSSVWGAGHYSGDCYWVSPEQVSKTPPPGEYLPKGSFIIRGKRNYMKAPVGIAIGVEINEETRLMGGPLSAIKQSSKYIVEIEPGDLDQNQVAKEISKIFFQKADEKDKFLIKSMASPDCILKFLPPGKSKVKIS
ncbi:MAG TPA: fibronectin-binding domain-containing protein [Methanocellales archaeon]|nr:fibronectin-binding domain-containing protein [Methanocellales archaeon]